MNILPTLILLPVLIVAFLMDVAIFFLLIRLLASVCRARPLLFLDRIGSAGVDVVTGAVAHHVRHWWTGPPLSTRQEEALTLLLISICRWALAVVLHGCHQP